MFNYDVISFIELVESKCCLWDNTSSEYKEKDLRKIAWREICTVLEPEFETFDDKMKEQKITVIVRKWSNLRDTFLKTLKTKTGKPAKKRYIYHSQMQFLLKTLTVNETVMCIPSIKTYYSETDDSRPCTPELVESEQASVSTISRKRKSRCLTTLSPKILADPIGIETSQTSRATGSKSSENDDDEEFLFSLLPSIKRIHEDEKLEFRIDMIQLIRNYTKRNIQ